MRGKNPTDSLSEADKVGGGGSEVKRGGKKKFGPNPRPMPDGPNESSWYGQLRVQKLTLLVFNDDVESLGQSFQI